MKETTCQKIQKLSHDEQIEILSAILSNEQTCLQCKQDTYLVVDRQKSKDLIIHTCACANCYDCVDINVQRGLYNIVEAYDVELID